MYESNKTYRKDKAEVPVLLCKIDGEPVCVKRKEVKKYVEDPAFQLAMSHYNYTKLWGLPNAQGWCNEPFDMLESITAIELEAKAIEHEEIEKSSSKGKHP